MNNFVNGIFAKRKAVQHPLEKKQGTKQVDGPGLALQRRGLKQVDKKTLYDGLPSFVDYLPWVEYLPDEKVFLLEDNKSVGAVFELSPIGTAGRDDQFLTDVRDTVESALQDSFDEYDVSPWVIQTYTFDTLDLSEVMKEMRAYVNDRAHGSAFTEAYFSALEKHYKGICAVDGLFIDDDVTQSIWGGRVRKNYVVIYRRFDRRVKASGEESGGMTAIESLNDTCDKFENALKGTGASLKRVDGAVFHRWLQAIFNPSTQSHNGDIKAFLDTIAYDAGDLPSGDAFSESLFYAHPRSDIQNKCWWFDETPVRCLSVDGIRRRPRVGHATGEIQNGDAINAMFDQMPQGSVMVSTIVVVPQDTVEQHIDRITVAAKGDESAAMRTRADCVAAKEILGEKHKLYRASFAFYIKADNLKALNRATNKARSLLLSYQYRAVAIKDDMKSLDNFVLNLPMVYDANEDRVQNWRVAQLTVVQHLANMSCLFGRSRGTGHPGIINFNRGGEPLFFDPLNSQDRKKNGHMLLFGPTGAGKSAKLVEIMAHVMAVKRPRVFMLEIGNSFGLMVDWFAEHGLTVNKVSFKPGSGVTLMPFADACKALDQDEYDIDVEREDEDDAERDYLGEMEIVAQLMITGGEEKEAAALRRADKRLIRDAILLAAKTATAEDRITMTEDVRDAFMALSRDSQFNSKTCNKLEEMSHSIGLFCDGFNGEVFNTVGEPWPECDVTLVDLATFSREGYEAHLAIAVISTLNLVNNIAERDQHNDREIIVPIDEAHIITTNVLLAPYLVKIVKMWRKLGTWLWSATQNLDDYPGISKKMLNMIEWWICLAMPKEEVESIARFKNIGESQRKLLLSATKSPKKYSEGVVLTESMEALFRSVPPSLILSLAMTEKHEKAERAAIMKKHNCSEVEAARKMADRIDEARGIADVGT